MMFTGKVVVITGSSQGIGLKTAELLAKRGAKIVLNSRSDEKLKKATAYLSQFTQHVTGLAGDVSDINFCHRLRNHAIKQFEKIDILINNAGLASGGLFSNMADETYCKVFNSNVLGSLYPTMVCFNDLKTQKGSVIFISSLAGIIGLPNYSAYSASKRSIVSLAESFKNEWVDDDVFVGINYPGFTENDENKKIINSKGQEVLLHKRENVRASSQEYTAGKIIYQLEKKKFRVYSTYGGRIIQLMYNFFPKTALFIIKMNRKKIMKMQ